MLDRRKFLVASAGLASLLGSHLPSAAELPDVQTPSDELFARDEERYWAEVRKQFIIPDEEIYLNNGTVGSCPIPALKAAINGYIEGERLAQTNSDDYPLWGYNGLDFVREPLAAFVGANKDEIALVRNATEANNYIANGLDLTAGDEVLLSDQEHPGGEEPWRLREKRYGIRIRKFELPKPPHSPAEILNRIDSAITPRTRVIFVSHATTVTGVVLPVREICHLAHSKGILCAIDGAQTLGQMFGTSNLPAMLGLRAAIQFAKQIGIDRIEKRHRHLADAVLAKLLELGLESWTSADPTLRCALITMNGPGMSRAGIQSWLWEKHRMRIRGWDPSAVRISTSYFLRKSEIDRFVAAVADYLKNEKRG